MIGHGRLLAEGSLEEVVRTRDGHTSYRLFVDDAKRALGILGSVPTAESANLAVDVGRMDGLGGAEIMLSVGPEGVGPAVRTLVGGGVEVLALVPARPSLEDLFLELTEGER